MISNDTIYALSSAPGRAGIAVVRVSGAASQRLCEMLTGRALLLDRTARVARLSDPADGHHLDTALVIGFAGPNSSTGEDVVELHVHGGRAVVDAAFAAISSTGLARMAEPGEFTRRAFENGRLDLTEVEGLADLIDAETEAQRRQALRQFEGALSALYLDWRDRLIWALAHLEAGIDFIDEGDVPNEVAAAVRPSLDALIDEMAAHLDDARRGEILREGFSIAIIGPPNAGKSSVLNHLAQRDAAIVSSTAGTTRDVIEVRLDLAGYAVSIADTAGLRSDDGVDEVEAEGIRRAKAVAAAADLRLGVVDGSEADVAETAASLGAEILLANKSDIAGWRLPNGTGDQKVFAVSAREGTGFRDVLVYLSQYVERVAGSTGGVTATRLRHREAVQSAIDALRRAQTVPSVELACEEVRHAAFALGRVTGAVDVEDILDVIFRDFCIGK